MVRLVTQRENKPPAPLGKHQREVLRPRTSPLSHPGQACRVMQGCKQTGPLAMLSPCLQPSLCTLPPLAG